MQKCLEKSPNERYQRAEELRLDLVNTLTSPEVINFKHEDVDKTLVMDSINNNSSESNLKTVKKSPRKVIRGLAMHLFYCAFGAFSYLGATLARKYLEVPEVLVPDVIGLTEEEAVKT